MSDDRGPWFQTFTGKAFYPLDPRPEDICIEDIAHALSMICRFGGHTRQFYSVAQHSVGVSRHVAPHLAKRGLMHDAPEAYLWDIISPLKGMFPQAAAMENDLMQVIADKYELPAMTPADHAAVKVVDIRMLLTEANEFMAPSPQPWEVEGEPFNFPIPSRPPQVAKMMFMDTFELLFND